MLNEAKQLVRGIQKRPKEESTTFPQIYEEERGKIITTDLGTSPAEVAGKLPFCTDNKTQLHKERHFLIPQSAKDANDIILNDEWSQTESGEHFILIDDISDGSRIIMFGTDDSLRRLCASDIVSMDGTFKVCPRVFISCLLSIHICMKLYFQSYFVYYPTRRQQLTIVCSLLITKCAEREYRLKPATFIVDFELAVYNVVRALFLATSLKDCLFHFGQAL